MPGSHALLDDLRRRGMTLYLASGTDLKYVRQEAELLGVAAYFGDAHLRALDDYQNFSKQMIIDKILRRERPARGGVAGLRRRLRGDRGGEARSAAWPWPWPATRRARRGVNAWKRDRLVRAGADVVIPEYRQHERLLSYLFAEESGRSCGTCQLQDGRVKQEGETE